MFIPFLNEHNSSQDAAKTQLQDALRNSVNVTSGPFGTGRSPHGLCQYIWAQGAIAHSGIIQKGNSIENASRKTISTSIFSQINLLLRAIDPDFQVLL